MDIDTDLAPLSANRKRRASSPAAAGDSGEAEASAVRARFTSDLDDIALIPAEEAWDVDLSSILEGSHEVEQDATAGAEQWPDGRMDGVSEAMMTNLRALEKDGAHEVVVLCVLGDLDGHYWLLQALLPVLRMITPEHRFFAIASDVAARRQRLFVEGRQAEWAYLGARKDGVQGDEIPFIQPSKPSRTFTRLGLLHPHGGGREPLDAILVLERRGSECKRRLVLPFGWGGGRHVQDEAGGWMVRGRLMQLLREVVEEIVAEWKGG